jgi:hypothetical protein
MPVQVRAQIHAEKASLQFKRARKELNGRMRTALLEAGETEALPAARIAASRYKISGVPIDSTLVIRATSRGAYLTTRLRGMFARAVGLLEYGGTVSTPLVPKGGGSGHFPIGGGEFRSTITGPRTYQPRLFLSGAVQSRRRRIELAVRDRLLDAFTPEFEID